MKKLFFLICALLAGGVSGAWAQLTSISDGGLYNIQFVRTDLDQDPLKVKSNLYHDVQNNYANTIAAVFQFESTGEANTYYIKEFSSTQYVYAYETSASTGSSQVKIKLGKTTLPVSDSATPEESLGRYKWVISYVGTKGTIGTYLWTIKPKENTDVYWSVYGQRASNPVALYGTNTSGYDHYVWGFVQFITPTIASCIESNCKVSDITGLGYSKDDIAEYYKPAQLDVVGWPTTTAYNTFKTAINALSDDAVVKTAYSTPYQTMCGTYVAPTSGKFYRLTDYQGKTLYATGTDAVLSVSSSVTNPVSSVFYTQAGSTLKFVSYLNGHYLYNKASVGATVHKDPQEWYSYTFDHYSGHPVGTLRFINGSNYWASNGSTVGFTSAYPNGNNTAFYFEEVTSLPVTFKGQYASFYSPVDLEIPDGVNVYTGYLDGDKLTLTKVTTGTLPHNTGAILEYEAYDDEMTTEQKTKSFNILSTSTSGSSALQGITAAQSVSADTKLVLGKSGETWGIYSYSGTVLGGFKAYMDKPAGVKGYSFSFDDVNEVVSILNGEKVDSEVYDLSGRQIKKPTRGFYMTKGQKAYIK